MREPRFWSVQADPRSRDGAPLTRLLLTPLAWLYGAITARRIARASPVKIAAAVICVGNITAGGVGKSPVVAALRQRLSEQSGQRVATLSRGFGGRLKGPLKVDTQVHTARQVGDEPLMLAHSGESWIGANRSAAGLAMAAEGVEIIVMDDGHQNPDLTKDFSFVVVDAEAVFGNRHVIPKGPLREPIARGLSRADAIIVIGSGPVPPEVTACAKPVLRAAITVISELPNRPYVAFAGIGRPEKVFDTLRAIGADLRESIPFGDHHFYSDKDLKYLRNLAADHGAKLITTEKDYARLSPEQRGDILTLPVQVQFDDTDLLDSLLSPVLKAGS